MPSMKNRDFLTYLFLCVSALTLGCEKLSLSAEPPTTNTIAVASPTPPPSENTEEPPPSPALSPKLDPSLNPNLVDTDVKLISAVKSENLEDAKRLLANGANPNSFFKVSDGASSNYYETILGLAIDKKNADIVRLLLEKGANANIHSFDGNKPPVLWEDNFSNATSNEDVVTMKLLADYHADLTGNKDSPPIITSVRNVEVLDFLMKHGFDINVKDFEGNSVLMKAIFDNKAELVKAILKYNPNLDQKTEELVFTDYKKLTPLQLAERYASKEVVEELKKAGAKK